MASPGFPWLPFIAPRSSQASDAASDYSYVSDGSNASVVSEWDAEADAEADAEGDKKKRSEGVEGGGGARNLREKYEKSKGKRMGGVKFIHCVLCTVYIYMYI